MGDPSGRKDERKRADSQKVIADAVDLDANVISFFERASVYAQKRIKGSTSPTWNYKNIMNNNSWLKNLNLLNFLTTAGVNVRLNTMLARERCGNSLLLPFSFVNFPPVFAHAWSPTRASRSQSSHINFYKHTISSIYIITTNVPSNLEAQTSGETYWPVSK